MKLREIFRFELTYQLRRVQTWLYFTVLLVATVFFVRGSYLSDALYDDFYLNAPFIIASTTVFISLLWFLVAAPVAGEAAARDVETGMHPIAYTAPVTKAAYLGGRFLAALVLNALLLLAVPLGVMVAVYATGVDAAVVGPFRPAGYLTAYCFIALPNAFAATAIQFAWAALGRRAIASYLGSVVLFFLAYGGMIFLGIFVGREDLATLLDLFGHIYITSDLILGWTPIEKNTRLVELEGPLLRSRLFWTGIALATLAFTHIRFRFAHHTTSPWWSRAPRRRHAQAPEAPVDDIGRSPVSAPQVRQTFDLATYVRQTLVIAWISFLSIAKSRGGLVLLAAIAAVVVIIVPEQMDRMGTALLPRTEHILNLLTTRLTTPLTPWIVTPLLIVLYSGELVWREREAGLGEITDAAPVPEWVLFLGKFLGLGMVLLVWMGFLTVAGLLVQVRMGYHDFEIGLYLQVLFGLQLPEYLLFAVLALVVQGMATHKYMGHLFALVAYGAIVLLPMVGVQHNLLVYGAGPSWTYTDMRGFGPTIGPWLWFKLYWGAWALLLVVVARLLWLRGMEGGLGVRLRLARLRFTRPTARAAAVAAGLIMATGGFIFYNTNVLNEYTTDAELTEQKAEYERRYARFAGVPQPRLTGTRVRVEIYPERRAVEIRGTYLLVNGTAAAIDSIHVATRPGRETVTRFDRRVTRLLVDEALGHRIYALEEPLQPGDSLRLSFEVAVDGRGFRNSGAGHSIMENSTFFRNESLFPAIGYQPVRELIAPADRRRHGLPARSLFPSLDGAQDVTGEGSPVRAGAARVDFEAVVGTDADQIAVAPGRLRRTWTDGGRRYFHYATDTPIASEQSFFSADYAVHKELWTGPSPPAGQGPPGAAGQVIPIEVYYHPRHSANLDRIVRSVRASLDRYTRAFGPYRWGYVRLVENPGSGTGAHAAASTIDFTEGFSRFNPGADPQGLDMPFAVIAHEMAHLFQPPYEYAEGAPLLSESFAWYAAMGVVEETYGREHLERLRRFFRQPTPIPPIRQSLPLLRAMDPYAAYRKGPFAFYALSEYMGEDRVNLAWRRLIRKHRSGAPPLPTSLDLYRELEAVTPDSLRYLLHDLLAENTFWELETRRATATPTPEGDWRVTLNVRARKVTVDPAGVETEVPMDEAVQIGVFAPTGGGADFGETLYLRMHRIRTGEQTITVTVPTEPADAGIDPFHLLIELERFDNVEKVQKIER